MTKTTAKPAKPATAAKKAASAPKASRRITGNKFHAFQLDQTILKRWEADWDTFKSMIWDSSTPAKPVSVGETALLRWFGESVERIALMVYAIHKIVPTHVARELTIGDFRADFAWAEVDADVDATVGLIEFENCEPKTLFEQKNRKAPYLGSRFLDGFGQLVDWCAFGYDRASTDSRISTLLGTKHTNAAYVFSLVAGHREFSNDKLALVRLQWWDNNLKLGHGTITRTFDQVEQEGRRNLKVLNSVRR
ncbi:hypothetical protein [Burkholderia vietnamiensis]|uniref:hypothetical protein n=1 Tax=Burkholderia vietnamiensis TaxID=60552 RepID=UPI000A6C53D1|nr:hypothetical protein [Burkholderia vietnamiensis]